MNNDLNEILLIRLNFQGLGFMTMWIKIINGQAILW